MESGLTESIGLSTVCIMNGDHYGEYISKRFIGISIVLSLIFWAAFTRMLLPFVPSESPMWAYFFAGMTAACLTGVFYLATHMFQLVLKEQLKARR
jgi:hypothetical protein